MADYSNAKTDLRKLQARYQQLRSERDSWVNTYRDIARIFLPRSGAFLNGRDYSRGRRLDNEIINNTTVRAARTLGQGMHAGMTNPARPWFKNSVQPTKSKMHRVKVFLDALDRVQRGIFSATNIYRALPMCYREMGVFGTAAGIITKNRRGPGGEYSPSLRNMLHMHVCTAGSYCLAADDYGVPDTFYRELYMTVDQLVRRFGLENVSKPVKRLYAQHEKLDHTVKVIHVIEPRSVRTMGSRFAKDMPYRATYFEDGCDEDTLLSEEGFRRFPVVVPRWDVIAEDVYGSGPGWEAIGDGRGLQHKELRKDQTIDYQTLPPLQMPTMLKNGQADTLPGGISFYDATGPQAGIRTAFEVQTRLPDLGLDIREIERRVQETFYVDLFRAILDDRRSNVTAREIAEKHQEKLLLLGPVIERVQNELLVPLVDMCFDAIVEGDEERAALGLEPLMPEIPGELDEGEELQLEFDSMLSQAMKATQAADLDRYTGTITAMSQVFPQIVDKVDPDELADEYADMLAIAPNVNRDTKKVVQLREARARAEAGAAQAQVAELASKAEKNTADAAAVRASAGAPVGPPTDVAPAIATANALTA